MNTRPVVALRAALAVLLIGALPVSGFGQAAPAAAQPPAAPQPAPAQPPPAQPPRPAAARARAAGDGADRRRRPRSSSRRSLRRMPTFPSETETIAAVRRRADSRAARGRLRRASCRSTTRCSSRSNRTSTCRSSASTRSCRISSIEQAAGVWKPNLTGQLEFHEQHDSARQLALGRRRRADQQARVRHGTASTRSLPVRHQLLGRLGRVAPDDRTTRSRTSTRVSDSTFSFNVTQPLLRGLRIDGNRATFMVQKKNSGDHRRRAARSRS